VSPSQLRSREAEKSKAGVKRGCVKLLIYCRLRKDKPTAVSPAVGIARAHLGACSGTVNFSQGDLMKKQKGFSLIELLIVVAIILIIAAIAIPNLMRARMSANESSAAVSDDRVRELAGFGHGRCYAVRAVDGDRLLHRQHSSGRHQGRL